MALEPVWLLALLPLAAISGWLSAAWKYGLRRKGGKFPAEYMLGFKYLLNQQPDKAIEVFVRLAEIDVETLDIHLALGNVFRRQGEMERAIRIHENLINRPGLRPEIHREGLLELARDFMAAGLFDRAEKMFQTLIGIGATNPDVIEGLLQIYENQQEWAKLINIANRHKSLLGEKADSRIVHYHCQLVEQQIAAGDLKKAQEWLDRARSFMPKSPRANLLQADINLLQDEPAEAEKVLLKFNQEDREILLPEISRRMFRILGKLGRTDRLKSYVEELLEADIDALTLTKDSLEMLKKLDMVEEVRQKIHQRLEENASLANLYMLVKLGRGESAPSDSDTDKVYALLGEAFDQLPLHRCRNCGFEARQHYWHCPSCHSWDGTERSPAKRLPIHASV